MCCLLPSQCTVGSRVAMRVGGDFFFNPAPSDPSVDLLLVAGGVGINPLYSILLHTSGLLHLNHASGGRDYKIGSAHLFYSAKNTQELLFKVFFFLLLLTRNFRALIFDKCPHVCLEYLGGCVRGLTLTYPPSAFTELHHRGVSRVPRQTLLRPPRHAAERRCRIAPPAIRQP